jgi:hypothetical protein
VSLTRGTGFILPTRPDQGQHAHAGRIRIGAARRPVAHAFGAPVTLSQIGQTCTGFALLQGVHNFLAARGIARELISPVFPYWYARRALVARDQDVVDTGADPFALVDAVHDFGACAWTDMPPPATRDGLNMPPQTVAIVAAQRLKLELVTIFDNVVDTSLDYLAQDIPVLAALEVDKAFEQDAGPALVGYPTGEIAGIHCMQLDAYDASGTDVQNSWGYSWRNRGRAKITYDYLARARWAAALKVRLP